MMKQNIMYSGVQEKRCTQRGETCNKRNSNRKEAGGKEKVGERRKRSREMRMVSRKE